ncbi:MAG: sigma-70 family RNA polymerase sigma factor [Planctomycetota bacterium]
MESGRGDTQGSDIQGGATQGSDEQRLLSRLRRGEEAAFEELVRAQTPRLLTVARRLLANEEDARDAVQDGFLQAFRALPNFHGEALLSTWLYRIVVNAALTRIRRSRRRPARSIEALLPRFEGDGHRVLSDDSGRPDGAADLEEAERRALVRREIDELPASYRTILVLRDIEEVDTEEAARVLGITENLVKVRLHRARQALRERLSTWFAGGDA